MGDAAQLDRAMRFQGRQGTTTVSDRRDVADLLSPAGVPLSDPGAEEALYDIQLMRAFAGLELGRDAIPDETTILNFRHLLEAHDLTKAIFDAVARTSKTRVPYAWRNHHGRDADRRLAVDARSGLAHTAGVTTGKVHDAKVMDNLIREDDRAVFADKGYANEKKNRATSRAGVYWAVKEKLKAGWWGLSSSQLKRNRPLAHACIGKKNSTPRYT